MKLLILIALILLTSCSTLQKQKGYEGYTKNTNWKIEKL